MVEVEEDKIIEQLAEAAKEESVEKSPSVERLELPEFPPIVKSSVAKVVVTTIGYPLHLTKTLIELGYEPFPLRKFKNFILFGTANYYLPNGPRYLWNLYKKYGFFSLFIGLDSGICSAVTYNIVHIATLDYLDSYYPELGGEPQNLELEDHELTLHQSARVKIRDTIRDTLARFMATFVSRPFTVLAVQKIVGCVILKRESVGFLSALYEIGDSNGPGGLFSGFIPQFLSDFVAIVAMQGLRHAIEFGMRYFVEVKDEEEQKEAVKKVLRVSKFFVPLVVSLLGPAYPFRVTSTVMAASVITPSNDILLYMPPFSHWTNAYLMLKPEFATRGRLFFRNAKNNFRIRADQQAYKISSLMNRFSDKVLRRWKEE